MLKTTVPPLIWVPQGSRGAELATSMNVPQGYEKTSAYFKALLRWSLYIDRQCFGESQGLSKWRCQAGMGLRGGLWGRGSSGLKVWERPG